MSTPADPLKTPDEVWRTRVDGVLYRIAPDHNGGALLVWDWHVATKTWDPSYPSDTVAVFRAWGLFLQRLTLAWCGLANAALDALSWTERVEQVALATARLSAVQAENL